MMSGKRYKRFYVSESENQLTIYDNEGLDDYYHLGNDERDVKGICKLLNEQQATIEHLTVEKFKENKRFTKLLSEQQVIIKSKDKQLERLYNYFQDYLKDEISGNAFSEMWDIVKEDESWEDE